MSWFPDLPAFHLLTSKTFNVVCGSKLRVTEVKFEHGDKGMTKGARTRGERSGRCMKNKGELCVYFLMRT